MGIVVSFPSERTRIHAALSEVLSGVAFSSEAARLCAQEQLAETVARFAVAPDFTFSFSALGAVSPADHAIFQAELQAQAMQFLRSVTQELLLELIATQVKLCIAKHQF